MKSTLPALLVFMLGALLAVGADEKDKKPKAAELTEPQLKAHVQDYLDDDNEAVREKLKPFRSKLVLGVEGLSWNRKKLTCVWKVRFKPTVMLTADEKASLEADLQLLLRNIVYQYKSGLIFDAGMTSLAFAVVVSPSDLPRTQEKPRLPAPLPPRVQRPVEKTPRYAVYWMPAPCGSGCCGWFYLAEVPALVSPSLASDALPPPRQSSPVLDKRYVSTAARRSSSYPTSRSVDQVEVAATSVPRSSSYPTSRSVPRPSVRTIDRVEAATATTPPVLRRPRALNIKGLKAKDAAEYYWDGCKLYWQQEYGQALQHFEVAAKLADDARYWYFLALSERAVGDHDASRRSAARGGQLQREGKPRAALIGLALERVQGSMRGWLRDASDRGASASRYDDR